MAGGHCKEAAFGNCGPMRNGEDYCLLHKPEKSKEEAKMFYEKIKEQAITETDEKEKIRLLFDDDVGWQGYIFPEGDESEDCFKDAAFKGRAYFGDAIFEGKVSFRNASFEDRAYFSEANFKSEAYFGNAIFGDAAFFHRATFEDRGGFLLAKFKGEVDFSNATFKSGVALWGAIFKGGVYCEGTTFEDEASFEDATFEGEASFVDATFEGKTSFVDATFKGCASFNGSSCIAKTSFSGALFERTCSFANREFGGVLYFKHTAFQQGVIMEYDLENPEPEKYKLPQAEQEGCRVQKIAYEQEGRKDAAEAMFVREMRARRRDREAQYEDQEGKTVFRKKPLWDPEMPLKRRFRWGNLGLCITAKAEYLLVDLLSEYGTNWKRVVGSSFVLIIAFALIYLLGDIRGASTAWDLFYFSMASFTSLGDGGLNPVGWARALSGFQSLIGAFFIALFVVVFARRWMR